MSVEEIQPFIRQFWQPAFFGWLFITGREGYIGNPGSPLIPQGTGGGGGGGGGGNPTVSFNVIRNAAAYIGTGYVTVGTTNHVTTGTGIYSTQYPVGTVLSFYFTAPQIPTCTPTTPQSYTVLTDPNQSVTINIPC